MAMSKYKTIIDNEDFKVGLELEGDDILFVHCDVHKWSPSVIKRIRLGFQELRTIVTDGGYDTLYTYTQNRRWCDLVDKSYTFIANIEVSGESYEVLGWEQE